MMTYWRHLITGHDNQTIAIGRVLGLIVFGVFVLMLPALALVLVALGRISIIAWDRIFMTLQIYVPAILFSIAGLIGLTAPSEPRGEGGYPSGPP